MDNLQYPHIWEMYLTWYFGFKPYYKWITFNTVQVKALAELGFEF